MPSYGEVSFEALGKTGLMLVNLSLVMSQAAFCSTFFIIVYENACEVLKVMFGPASVPSAVVFMTVLAVLWTPITWIRRMKYFALPSFIGNIFMVLVVILIFVFMAIHCAYEEVLGEIDVVNWTTLPLTIGMSVYTFEGIGLIIPIYAGCTPKMRLKFKKTLRITLSWLCLLYITFATLGYVAYGDKVHTVVLLDLPKGSYIKTIVQILFIFEVYFSFPLTLYPVIGIMEPLFVKGSGQNSTLAKIGKNAFRTMAVVAAGAVAVGARKELDRFVAVIGAVCCMPLAIIYPSFIHFSVIKGNAIIDLSCAFLGIALMLFTLYRSIQEW